MNPAAAFIGRAATLPPVPTHEPWTAFDPREAEMYRVSSADVPPIYKLDYASVQDYTRDTKLLDTWLRQQGLSSAEIAKESYNHWSRLKERFYDQGLIPESQYFENVPHLGGTERWAEVGLHYDIPPEHLKGAQAAWESFVENGSFEGDLVQSQRQLR